MKPRIGIITSKGGHLYQMSRLRPWWNKYDRFWVTFPGEDSESLLSGERVYYGYYPETRHIIHAIRHIFLALRILRKERPSVLISCGAGIAPPFFIIARFMGIKTVFIEVFDLVKKPSLTGKLISPFVTHMLVQHEAQKRFYKRAISMGPIL